MNRREFLQSLAAIGFSVALPEGVLASAPEAVIDEAWQSALQEPMTFYVSSWGTLSYGVEETWPQSRANLLGYSTVSSLKELLALANESANLDGRLEQVFLDLIEAEEVQSPDVDDWRSWLARSNEETIDDFITIANDWVEADVDESDWETASLRGYTDQGAAKSFFQYDFEYCDDFNIVIVEGDHPGSSYFAAELRMDVDDANALAAELELPIRFEWCGD